MKSVQIQTSTRLGLHCLICWPLSLMPYLLSLIPNPCSLTPSTVPLKRFRWGLLSLLSLWLLSKVKVKSTPSLRPKTWSLTKTGEMLGGKFSHVPCLISSQKPSFKFCQSKVSNVRIFLAKSTDTKTNVAWTNVTITVATFERLVQETYPFKIIWWFKSKSDSYSVKLCFT